jgi:hypothetical protein
MTIQTLSRTPGRSKFTRGVISLGLIAACGLTASSLSVKAGARDDGGQPSDAQLQDLFWRNVLGDITLPTDDDGNAVDHGVALLDFPQTPGDGTPGSLDVTLDPNEPFFISLYSMLGFSYSDGTPSDPRVPLSLIKTLNITLKIDGHKVITNANVLDFYSNFSFRPPIAFDSPPANAIIFYQGVGLSHEALSSGHHVITLDAVNTQAMPPAFGGGFMEYHNTWNMTVEREPQKRLGHNDSHD